MAIDPAVTGMLASALAVMLVVSATQKWRDVPGFHGALDRYGLLPSGLLRPTAWTLPAVEAGAGVALVIEQTRVPGAMLGLGVLTVVTGAVVINLLRGRFDLGCGCGGLEDEQPLSWGLVLRNVVLALLLGVTLVATTARVLTWIDYLTVVVGGGALYGLYVVANQLLANQPRLLRLRYSA